MHELFFVVVDILWIKLKISKTEHPLVFVGHSAKEKIEEKVGSSLLNMTEPVWCQMLEYLLNKTERDI